MKLTAEQQALVERIKASETAAPPRRSPISDQAAQYAHDHHVTLGEAARRFGLMRFTVELAWARLYPNEQRFRT